MKQKFTLLITVFFLLVSIVTVGQTSLKMGASGGPAGNGPLTTSQAITLYENGTTAFSPAVTATYSLSNQQYAPGSIEGLAANSGLSFGGSLAASVNSPMGAFALYSLMNGISSPTNNLFTAYRTAASGTGVNVTTDRSISLFSCTDALINAATVNQKALNARVYYGDLTITFNTPVSNPVMQIVGLGGTVSFTRSGKTYDLGFATEFDLLSTNVSLNKLSGNSQLNVSATQITNNAAWIGASSIGSVSNGITRYGASGSVVALGNNITSITFKVFVRGDGGRVNNGSTVVTADAGINPVWSIGATNSFGLTNPNVSGDVMLFGVSLLKPVNVSGNVFNDANGGNVDNSTGGTNLVPLGMFANLTDANGKVVASAAVNANGTYSFLNVFEGDYTVSISTVAGVQGAAAPAITMPAGWINTGEYNGTPNTGRDAAVNGTSLSFTVAATAVTNINFGIERLPESNNQSYSIAQTPVNTFITLNGTGSIGNPGPLTGSDTEDFLTGGSLTGKAVAITQLPSNAELWYNNVLIQFGADGINPPSLNNPFTISNYNIALLQLKITASTVGQVSTSFNYAYTDAAGVMDATPASYTINWTGILPVESLNLISSVKADEVILNWITLNESNTAYFEVERSNNNVSFIKVGNSITAAGYNASVSNYNYTDDITAVQHNGTLYYRVKLYDKDGNFKYSNTAVVLKKTIEIKVWPNPFAEMVYVNMMVQSAGNVTVKISDINGRTIITKQQKLSAGINQVIIPELSALPKGIYILNVVNGSEKENVAFKLFKQ
ncbi:T9SS type A sorting domain-containing protein [Ferruginibacter sp.]|nr:T9SS type A sorting domain-containing protein [Ferruginibacter sp.]